MPFLNNRGEVAVQLFTALHGWTHNVNTTIILLVLAIAIKALLLLDASMS